MGLSLKKGYQEKALMEGKKITTSIKHLAMDLREVERWGSKEQEGLKKTLGWAGIPSFSQEVARRGRRKGLLLI